MAILTNQVIALCDGHGMETSGKRSDIFPDGSGLKSETGNFLHENEFNRAVVKYLGEHLTRNGFKVIYVAPTDEDTPLSTRVAIANNANAGLYVSIHANALTGKWGKAEGVETLAYLSDAKSKEIASVIHKHVKGGTPQVDRGLKDGSWLYVAKHTKMPAVLIECGFMDNLNEVKLLLSDSFRKETAKEIAEGICELYGKVFKDEAKPEPKPEPKPQPKPEPVVVKPEPKVEEPQSTFAKELASAVEWAKASEISDGSSLDTYVTRAQLLAIMHRHFVGYKKMTWEEERNLVVQWAKENEISDGSDLDKNSTRAELLVILKRAHNKFGGAK